MARDVQQQHGDPFVAAVCSELEPYRWTSLTPEMLVRRVIGAIDRRRVLDLLEVTGGHVSAGPADMEPADRNDERVSVLVALLAEHHWRSWTLSRLTMAMLAALDTWWTRRQCLEVELGWLIRGDARPD
jgi:hypothetical protein